METLHAQRDLMTRDRANGLDTRKADSGHKGISEYLTRDPTQTAKHLKDTFDSLPLPPGVKQVGDVGLYGLELGTKLGKYIATKRT